LAFALEFCSYNVVCLMVKRSWAFSKTGHKA